MAAADCKLQEVCKIEQDFQEPNLNLDAVDESDPHPSTSPILQVTPSTTPPSEIPPSQSLPSSNEGTVSFPSTCVPNSSFSTNYISQGVDLFSGDKQVSQTCVKCNSSFPSPYALTVHWQEEHRENFKCKRCERTFAKKHNLMRHNCVNACNICGQQFTRRYNLKLHMQVHGDGSKMHKCEYCGKSFTRRYTLLTHTRSHSGIKLFKCSICGKAFTRQHTLNLHMKRHVTKSSFYCRKCYAIFTDAVSLQLHRETEHPKTPKQPDTQGATTSQSVQPSSNVVFPNSNTGYMYGTSNVGLNSSYHLDSYYQQPPQDVRNQFQNTYHSNRESSSTNQTEGAFDDRRDKNVMQQAPGNTASLEKPKWFEDERIGASSRGVSSRQFDSLRQDSIFMTPADADADVVTVIDSCDEAAGDGPMYPDQSTEERERVDQAAAEHDIFIARDNESEDADKMESQDADLEGETRRSLFPINTSKHHKRSGQRPVSRNMRSGWKRREKLVKGTSAIQIDILDPSSLEEMNPLLTPPRSSDTSTSRPTRASSESGSPSTASLLESPSYPTRPYPASLKIAPSGPSGEKNCLPLQITPQVLHNDEDQATIRAPSSHNGISFPAHHAGIKANSDSSSSSSLLASQSQQSVKHGIESQGDSTNWRCIHCGITFEESLMYVVHMGCHGQLDPYQCSMCGLLCQDRMAFTLHIIGGKHIKTQT